MTALKSLQARLRLAKLAMVTGAFDGPNELDGFVRSLASAGVDLIVLRDPRLGVADTIRALKVLKKACDGRALVATVDWSAAESGAADLVHLARDRPISDRVGLPPFRLVGRTAISVDDLSLGRDQGYDYLVWAPGEAAAIPAGDGIGATAGLVADAARQLPPFDIEQPPWFVTLGDEVGVDDLLAAGARRILIEEVASLTGDPVGLVSEVEGALRAAWRDDPAARAYRLAALTG